jgi:hypothetical protein
LAKLTKQQIRYLDQHGFEPEDAFDASGLARADYRARMKAEGKLVAYGVTRCLNGHRLRTRAGNCIQCSPASIAFARRAVLPGFIYIAQSEATSLLKIGFSGDDPDNRIYIANLEGYGGAWDWVITITLWSERAGAIEIAVQKALSDVRIDRSWIRNGHEIVTKELFDCSLKIATERLQSMLNGQELTSIERR